MLVEIKNEYLTLDIDTLGAELRSLVSSDGIQYLWGGDAEYWTDCSPVLFPFVGRLYGKRYTYKGREYPMGLHGFAMCSEFELVEQTGDRAVFSLCDSAATREQYPFAFEFRVCYALRGQSVEVTYSVDNRGEETMFFGLGGHPGFNVPLEEGTEFEDYYLRFSRPCRPVKIDMSDEVLTTGADSPYELEGGRILRLRHELFDRDAVVLKNTPGAVTIASDKTKRSVTVSYPDMPYVGFWHIDKKPAPYVCVEPWTVLPGRQGVVEDIAEMEDMICLTAHGHYENKWSVTIN